MGKEHRKEGGRKRNRGGIDTQREFQAAEEFQEPSGSSDSLPRGILKRHQRSILALMAEQQSEDHSQWMGPGMGSGARRASFEDHSYPSSAASW